MGYDQVLARWTVRVQPVDDLGGAPAGAGSIEIGLIHLAGSGVGGASRQAPLQPVVEGTGGGIERMQGPERGGQDYGQLPWRQTACRQVGAGYACHQEPVGVVQRAEIDEARRGYSRVQQPLQPPGFAGQFAQRIARLRLEEQRPCLGLDAPDRRLGLAERDRGPATVPQVLQFRRQVRNGHGRFPRSAEVDGRPGTLARP